MTKLLRWRCTAVFFTVDAKVSSSLGRTMGTTVTIAFLVLAFTVWVPKEKGASFLWKRGRTKSSHFQSHEHFRNVHHSKKIQGRLWKMKIEKRGIAVVILRLAE